MGARANSARGEAVLQMGDTAVRLVPSYENLIAVEEALDEGIIQIARQFANGDIRFKAITAIIAATGEPSLQDDEVKDMMRDANWVEVAGTVAQFLVNALTGGEAGKKPMADGGKTKGTRAKKAT